jgi:hypothetical protein
MAHDRYAVRPAPGQPHDSVVEGAGVGIPPTGPMAVQVRDHEVIGMLIPHQGEEPSVAERGSDLDAGIGGLHLPVVVDEAIVWPGPVRGSDDRILRRNRAVHAVAEPDLAALRLQLVDVGVRRVLGEVEDAGPNRIFDLEGEGLTRIDRRVEDLKPLVGRPVADPG